MNALVLYYIIGVIIALYITWDEEGELTGLALILSICIFWILTPLAFLPYLIFSSSFTNIK